MKVIVKIFIAGIIIGGLSWGGIYLYRRMTMDTKKINCANKFLFIGDSTTESPHSYADKLKENCPDIKITKLAKAGEKTDWMIDQNNTELHSGNKYDVVTILAGSNDIFGTMSIDKAKSNLQKMYEAAKATGAIVVAITPPNKAFYPLTTDRHRELIRQLTDWIKNNKSVDIFIDLGALVTDENLFASDKEHLTSAGQEILKNEFVKKVF